MSNPFTITFLGHQGWLFACGGQYLMVDPVLTDAFGHGGQVGQSFPRRTWHEAKFPRLDAVIITHEHDDHLDLRSLNLIDRAVPLYLSSRSSAAAGEVLQKMGFVVHRLRPFESLDFGTLRYRSLVGALDRVGDCDEWDVFPFVVEDRRGHGRFATAVDAPMHAETWQSLAREAEAATVFAYANNFTDSSFQSLTGLAVPSVSEVELAQALARRVEQFAHHCGRPAQTLICGAGWRYPGARAWINRHAFPVSNAALAQALTVARPEFPAHAAVPGDTWVIRRGRVERGPRAEFLTRVEYATELDVGAGERACRTEQLQVHGPAVADGSFTKDDERALFSHLEGFAEFLYGRSVYRQLHSVGDELEGRRATICLSLLVPGHSASLIVAYRPRSSDFIAQAGHESEYASGLRCWAGDLLAFMQGRLAASALCYTGRVQTWNHCPRRLRFSAHDLWMFGHPLRSASYARALYGHAHGALGEAEAVILGRNN